MSRILCWMLFGGLVVAGVSAVASQPSAASLNGEQAKVEIKEKERGERDEEETRGLERERLELEVRAGQLEVIERMTRISESESSTAAFALMHFEGLFENENDAVKFLSNALKDSKNPDVKRMIRIKLAEFYAGMGQPGKAREELSRLLTGK